MTGVFGENLLFCQKVHGLVDKVKSLRSLFVAERATCALSTRPILSVLSQFASFRNFGQYSVLHDRLRMFDKYHDVQRRGPNGRLMLRRKIIVVAGHDWKTPSQDHQLVPIQC